MITQIDRLFDPRSHIAKSDPLAYCDMVMLDVILASGKVREIQKSDAFSYGVNVIELVYSGNPPTMSFKRFIGWVCDIGAVGDKYANVNFRTALTKGSEESDAFPRRIAHPYRLYVYDGDLMDYLNEFIETNSLLESNHGEEED